MHPDYGTIAGIDHDVGLIKLTNAITFPSDNRVAPVCLPTAGQEYNNVDATITGWGAHDEGQYPSV